MKKLFLILIILLALLLPFLALAAPPNAATKSNGYWFVNTNVYLPELSRVWNSNFSMVTNGFRDVSNRLNSISLTNSGSNFNTVNVTSWVNILTAPASNSHAARYIDVINTSNGVLTVIAATSNALASSLTNATNTLWGWTTNRIASLSNALGTMAWQNSNLVVIRGGFITNTTIHPTNFVAANGIGIHYSGLSVIFSNSAIGGGGSNAFNSTQFDTNTGTVAIKSSAVVSNMTNIGALTILNSATSSVRRLDIGNDAGTIQTRISASGTKSSIYGSNLSDPVFEMYYATRALAPGVDGQLLGSNGLRWMLIGTNSDIHFSSLAGSGATLTNTSLRGNTVIVDGLFTIITNSFGGVTFYSNPDGDIMSFQNADITFHGQSTFNFLPWSTAVPSLGQDLVNKTYVDGTFVLQLNGTSTNQVIIGGRATNISSLTTSNLYLGTNMVTNGQALVVSGTNSDGSFIVRSTNFPSGGSGIGTNVIVNGVEVRPARFTNSGSVTWGTNANGDIQATAASGTTNFGQVILSNTPTLNSNGVRLLELTALSNAATAYSTNASNMLRLDINTTSNLLVTTSNALAGYSTNASNMLRLDLNTVSNMVVVGSNALFSYSTNASNMLRLDLITVSNLIGSSGTNFIPLTNGTGLGTILTNANRIQTTNLALLAGSGTAGSAVVASDTTGALVLTNVLSVERLTNVTIGTTNIFFDRLDQTPSAGQFLAVSSSSGEVVLTNAPSANIVMNPTQFDNAGSQTNIKSGAQLSNIVHTGTLLATNTPVIDFNKVAEMRQAGSKLIIWRPLGGYGWAFDTNSGAWEPNAGGQPVGSTNAAIGNVLVQPNGTGGYSNLPGLKINTPTDGLYTTNIVEVFGSNGARIFSIASNSTIRASNSVGVATLDVASGSTNAMQVWRDGSNNIMAMMSTNGPLTLFSGSGQPPLAIKAANTTTNILTVTTNGYLLLTNPLGGANYSRIQWDGTHYIESYPAATVIRVIANGGTHTYQQQFFQSAGYLRTTYLEASTATIPAAAVGVSYIGSSNATTGSGINGAITMKDGATNGYQFGGFTNNGGTNYMVWWTNASGTAWGRALVPFVPSF